MGKVLWKTAVLFGAILCLSLFRDGAAAEIPVPDKGFTLVLRAPTSERPRLVKISHVDGERKEEVLSGFTISLPKRTPVFFRVDQVNTVLYGLEISVEEEKSTEQTVPELLLKFLGENDAVALIKEAISSLAASAAPAATEKTLADLKSKVQEKALADLKSKVQAVGKFNKELESILYRSETSRFYDNDAASGFKRIKTDAETAAKAMPGMSKGTSQSIRQNAAIALAAVHTAYDEIGEKPPVYVPKDLSDASNKIAAPFLNAAENLRAIERATWDKEDTQNRILATKVTYTCAITPKGEGPKQLPASELKVTVKGVAYGWTIKFTQGPFLSRLRDKPYRLEDVAMNCATSSEANSGMSAPAFMDMTAKMDANAVPVDANATMVNANTEIKRKIVAGDVEDDVTTSLGALVHVSHSKCKWLGLSGGLGTDGANHMQVALGFSFFFNTQDEQSFALTFGGIAGKVKDLDGYAEGDFFKGTGSLPTKLVTRVNWFGAITFNFTSLLGSGLLGAPNN